MTPYAANILRKDIKHALKRPAIKYHQHVLVDLKTAYPEVTRAITESIEAENKKKKK